MSFIFLKHINNTLHIHPKHRQKQWRDEDPHLAVTRYITLITFAHIQHLFNRNKHHKFHTSNGHQFHSRIHAESVITYSRFEKSTQWKSLTPTLQCSSIISVQYVSSFVVKTSNNTKRTNMVSQKKKEKFISHMEAAHRNESHQSTKFAKDHHDIASHTLEFVDIDHLWQCTRQLGHAKP